MAPALEDALKAIAAEHNLIAVSVGVHTQVTEDYAFSANVHWDGFSRTNIACAHGHAADLSSALKQALANAVANRKPFEDQLPTLSIAA